jgi:hypothetical protein
VPSIGAERTNGLGAMVKEAKRIEGETAGEVTRLLRESRAGDREALNRVIPIVYDDLRRRAERELGRE